MTLVQGYAQHVAAQAALDQIGPWIVVDGNGDFVAFGVRRAHAEYYAAHFSGDMLHIGFHDGYRDGSQGLDANDSHQFRDDYNRGYAAGRAAVAERTRVLLLTFNGEGAHHDTGTATDQDAQAANRRSETASEPAEAFDAGESIPAGRLAAADRRRG